MSFEKTITAKVIRPESKTDAAYEDFEYVLSWIGRKGNICNLLFTDWTNTEKYNGEIINSDSSERIEYIPEPVERTVQLVSENLNRQDVQAFASIFTAKKINRVYKVYKVYKDGTTEGVAIVPGSVKWRQSALRYSLEITIRIENLRVTQ